MGAAVGQAVGRAASGFRSFEGVRAEVQGVGGTGWHGASAALRRDGAFGMVPRRPWCPGRGRHYI